MRGSVLALVPLLALASSIRAQNPVAPADSAHPTITVPAGTLLYTRLEPELRTRSGHHADSVHLQLAHPVVVHDTVVMPGGSYIEAVLDHITRRGLAHVRAELDLHLARLVYPNGYVRPTSDPARGVVREGVRADPSPWLYAVYLGSVFAGAGVGALNAGRPATATGVFIGAGVGLVALATVAAAVRGRVALDEGSPVELVLLRPLVLDARRATMPGATVFLPPPAPVRHGLCFTPGSPGTPDVVIPGTPGTPDVVIPGTPGTPDIVIPGTPGTPPTVIPGMPGTPGRWDRCDR